MSPIQILDATRVFRKGRPRMVLTETSPRSQKKESKAQHLLGLSKLEIESARTSSSGSLSRTNPYSASQSDASAAPILANLDDDRTESSGLCSNLTIPPPPPLAIGPGQGEGQHGLKRSLDAPVGESRSYAASPRLRFQSPGPASEFQCDKGSPRSEGPGRAEAEAAGTPPSARAASAVIDSASQETTPTKQLRLLGLKRVREKTQRKPKTQSSRSPLVIQSAFLSSQIPEPSGTYKLSLETSSLMTDCTSPPKVSASADNSTIGSQTMSASDLDSHQPSTESGKGGSSDAPYVKINTRRPKAGAKHWFDSLESDASDDDSNVAFGAHGGFAGEVEQALRHAQSNFTLSPVAQASVRSPVLLREGIAAELDAADPGPTAPVPVRAASRNPRRDLPKPETRPLRTRRHRTNPFVIADLSHQSVLDLSSSEDENEGRVRELEDAGMSTPVRKVSSSSLLQSAREPHSLEALDGSEIEIGTAQAANATKPSTELQHVKRPVLTDVPRPGAMKVPLRTSSRMFSLTTHDDLAQDTPGEGDLLSSFPATPFDAEASRSTSIRESFFSDAASAYSTRMMPAARHEQNLLTSARLKKAVMHHPQPESSQRRALRILEQGDYDYGYGYDYDYVVDDLQSEMTDDYSDRDDFVHHMAGYRPSAEGDTHRRHESGTTFQTSSTVDYTRRASEITMDSNFSDALHLRMSGLVPRTTDQRHPHNEPPRTTDYRASSSPASETWTDSRDSHVVLLDSLDQQLLREEIPSRLFMEAPFLGWDAQSAIQTAH